MLLNPLTLLSLGTSLLGGKNPVSTAVDGVSSLLGGIGDVIGDQFSSMLEQNASAQNGLKLVSEEALSFDPELVANNLAGKNLPTELKPIEQQTLNYIEQILSNSKTVDGQNLTSTTQTENAAANTQANDGEVALTESQLETFAKIQQFLDQNKEEIAKASENEIDGLMDVITKMLVAAQSANETQKAAATTNNNNVSQNAAVNIDANKQAQSQAQAPQLLEPKADPRLLGKDNLQKAVNNSEDRSMQTVSSMLGSNKSLFEDKMNSAKAMSGEGDFMGSKFAGLEQMGKSHIDNRFAALNNTAVVKYTSAEAPGQYGIAKINKSNGRIEIVLEPASLGKVDIKIDFHADGKTSLMVSAERKETLDLLQKDAKYFEKILADSGIKADSGSLSFNLRNPNTGTEFANNNGQHGGFNQFNMAIPTNEANKVEERNNYSNLYAYQQTESISGLNILV
jgi:hypothetical protein